MNSLIQTIEKRIIFLEEIICRKEKEVEKSPQGVINVDQSGGRIQFYYKKKSSDKIRKYIKNEDRKLVKELCQKDYDERVLLAARKEKNCLKRIKSQYEKGVCENVYEKLNPCRKEFINPITLPDDEFITNWLQEDYPRKGFVEDAPEYYTDNGERVRSKSEILIANVLKKHNIPYKYEAPLQLKGYGTIHPDFTVLNVRKRKEYYWEHMGKMDDFEYLEGALNRIIMYEKNDIFPGDKLILSHETLKYPIDLRNIEKMVIKYFK